MRTFMHTGEDGNVFLLMDFYPGADLTTLLYKYVCSSFVCGLQKLFFSCSLGLVLSFFLLSTTRAAVAIGILTHTHLHTLGHFDRGTCALLYDGTRARARRYAQNIWGALAVCVKLWLTLTHFDRYVHTILI